VEVWYLPCRSSTRWIKIMAQINIPRLPQAPSDYSEAQINQLITSLDQLITLLNSSYTPEQLRNEDEAIAWFIG
jgi:hypothetical protein